MCKKSPSGLVRVLAIESSCDETAVAILQREEDGGVQILSSPIASQIDLHRRYGGVVPELASRTHSRALETVLLEALETAGVCLSSIDAFGATLGPGLASSLLVGATAGKVLSLANQRPFFAINHMEGHLLSPFLQHKEGLIAHVGLIISGGHTLLVEVESLGHYRLLGTTRDDAAGEAYDKVAKMLGLDYPGGPEIEKRAVLGNPNAFDFPRSMIKDGLDFSFSGLKTAVLYVLEKLDPHTGRAPQSALNDLCASFEQAVLDVLIAKSMSALEKTGKTHLALSGGVSCNEHVKKAFGKVCQSKGIELHLAPPSLTTDNAAMIAYGTLLHAESSSAGLRSDLLQDIDPNWALVED